MELNEKLTQLEERIDKVIQEASEVKNAKEAMQRDYDELLERFINCEEELKRCNIAKDEAKSRIENILNKLG